MHVNPMPESAGTTGEAKETDRKCSKCKGPMRVRIWESSCGGYEDEKFTCMDPKCGHVEWVEGIDS